MLFLFSYWIFFWFILHILNIITFNPFIILIIIYIFTIIGFIYILINKSSLKNLIKYFFINIFLKFLFILFLKTDYTINDINFGILLYLIYLLIMLIFNVNPIIIYKKIFNSYINNENYNNNSIISRLYDNIYNKYFLK
jgi:hypothetical protein